MALYHATLAVLTPGEKLIAKDRSIQAGNEAVENAFHEARVRPVSRLRCFFASDNPAFAALYLAKEQSAKGRTTHIYEVSIPVCTAHPMVLVFGAKQRLEDNSELIAAIISEYWAPKMDWKFLEYVGECMTVIQEIDFPSAEEQEAAMISYSADYDAVVRQWGRPPSRNRNRPTF